MSQIYILAGPPGVGKSTNGNQYVESDLDIINEDEMRFKYKAQGYPDYQQQAVFRVRETVKRHIIASTDFAYELNLGYQDQYDYIVSAKTFSRENKLNVTLFFSDSLQLCLDRARIRHENGLHLVPSTTVTKMYNNTIPLLKSNFAAIDTLRLVNAEKSNEFFAVAEYSKEEKQLSIFNGSPKWFAVELRPFIEQYIADLKVEQPGAPCWKPDTPVLEDDDRDIEPDEDRSYKGPKR